MSNGDKKPGVKDISDLKARLGKFSKGGPGGSKPGAPSGPPVLEGSPFRATADLDADSSADLGMETQVVRIEMRPDFPDAPVDAPITFDLPSLSAPQPEVARVNVARTIPGPPSAAPAGSIGGLSLGADLFKKPVPAAEPARPAVAPQVFAPAPPAAPNPQERFINPLAMVGVERRALSAEDEALLERADTSAKGMKPPIVGVIAAVSGLMCLVLGVTMGKSSVTNEFLDAQITETGMVRDRVVPLLDKMEELANVVERMDPRKVDWQAVQQMPTDLPAIDAASILSTRVPLSPDVSGMLGKAVADLDGLFRISVDHRAFTLMRDKDELESLEKGDTFNNNQYFAAVFTPVDPKTPLLKWVPPNAQIVAVTSKPHLDASGENFVVPVRLRSGQEQEIPVQRILLVDKGELFDAGKANVLTAYSKRVEQMRARIGSVRMYASNLKNKLNAEASRVR